MKSTKDEAKDKVKEMDAKILSVMFGYHMDHKANVTVDDVANGLGLHVRHKLFRNQWGILKNTRNLIGKSTSGNGLVLTKKGLDEATTPEYKEYLKDMAIVPKTNAEHQEKIKKYLKKSKSAAIFDFLLMYGSLSNAELSALVGQNARSHAYFYSLKELRAKGYVEIDPNSKGKEKKFRLTEKSFKTKEDRPNETDINTKELAKLVATGRALIESRQSSNKKGKGKKLKCEVSDDFKRESMKLDKDNTKDIKIEENLKDQVKNADDSVSRNRNKKRSESKVDSVKSSSELASLISEDSDNSNADDDSSNATSEQQTKRRKIKKTVHDELMVETDAEF